MFIVFKTTNFSSKYRKLLSALSLYCTSIHTQKIAVSLMTSTFSNYDMHWTTPCEQLKILPCNYQYLSYLYLELRVRWVSWSNRKMRQHLHPYSLPWRTKKGSSSRNDFITSSQISVLSANIESLYFIVKFSIFKKTESTSSFFERNFLKYHPRSQWRLLISWVELSYKLSMKLNFRTCSSDISRNLVPFIWQGETTLTDLRCRHR